MAPLSHGRRVALWPPGAQIDDAEVVFLALHFLSAGPLGPAVAALEEEALRLGLLPARLGQFPARTDEGESGGRACTDGGCSGETVPR